MAVESIEIQKRQFVLKERAKLGEKMRDLFSFVMELADLYFGSPMRLDFLDSEHRANLSVKERAMIDADLYGI